MSKQSDHNHTSSLLKRGVREIIVESEFKRLINQGNPLRLKMGFDPSAPDLHLGHAVGLRKLRQLQDLGHKVIVIVGDVTAQIGDPSGQSVTRPMLTEQEVQKNAETYLSQFYKIVDPDRTETRMQSEWFGPFKMSDVIKLTGKFTIAQLLARDDFAKRFKNNHPITITELLYPILQAYDSVAVEADVEFGGTDQKFNLLLGRDLQEMMGQQPQQCFIMPLLEGTDGVQKMSKTLGNYIGIDEEPNDMFGKIMSLPDKMITPYFENLTDVLDKEIEQMSQSLSAGSVNPMELKKDLAKNIVAQFHDDNLSRSAANHFERTVQKGEIPDDLTEYEINSLTELQHKRLTKLLTETKLVKSSSEARRLINQGAVQVDGEKIDANSTGSILKKNSILKVGKRRFIKITVLND